MVQIIFKLHGNASVFLVILCGHIDATQKTLPKLKWIMAFIFYDAAYIFLYFGSKLKAICLNSLHTHTCTCTHTHILQINKFFYPGTHVHTYLHTNPITSTIVTRV